ncbi:MAG TPA: hypothetical protein GX708_03085 [Gallicola sp.]|nr:hypothetical protein [Gallicola sp.]
MKIFNNNRNVYLIHKMGEGNYKLCKVLNEYDDVEAANDDLVKLLTDQVTERKLLKEFSQKED